MAPSLPPSKVQFIHDTMQRQPPVMSEMADTVEHSERMIKLRCGKLYVKVRGSPSLPHPKI